MSPSYSSQHYYSHQPPDYHQQPNQYLQQPVSSSHLTSQQVTMPENFQGSRN
jgi:hypothetical protein